MSALQRGFLVDVPRLKSHISHLNLSDEFVKVHKLHLHPMSSAESKFEESSVIDDGLFLTLLEDEGLWLLSGVTLVLRCWFVLELLLSLLLERDRLLLLFDVFDDSPTDISVSITDFLELLINWMYMFIYIRV